MALVVLGLVAAAMIVFAFEWVSVDVVALVLVAFLVLFGVLTPQEAFAGFASEVIIVLCAIFVLSGALIRTGVMEEVGRVIYRLGGEAEARVVGGVMTLSAALSSLISNTNTTAVLTPAVIEFSRHSKLSPSRFLIPLAYASMLGGACTLIGTSANLAAAGYIERAGMAPIGLFEFLPVGLAVVVAGIAYMTLVGHRFLPRRAPASLSEEYELGRYLSEVVINAECELTGKDLESLALAARGVNVLAVRRGDQTLFPETAGEIRVGDLLLVEADRRGLLDLEAIDGVDFESPGPLADTDLAGGAIRLTEGLVMPGSRLIGRTLREIDLRRRYGASVLAVHRRGVARAIGLREMRLGVGDVLLLRADEERLSVLQSAGGVRLIGDVAHEPLRRRKGAIVLGALGGAVATSGLGLLPISIAFLLAVLVVVLTRSVAVDEMYTLIDWRVIVLIGGMTSVGLAIERTGAAEMLARVIAGATAPLGMYAVMAAFVILTMGLTQPLSNAAAALVVLPVAISTAGQLGIDPRGLAILVTLSASLSFIAPFEPACLLVYSPGKYRFRDFVIAGLPLSAIALVLLLLLVPVFWPLG